MEINFNKQLERPRFIYKPNPLVPRAFQIFELMAKGNSYEHVGDYVLINKEEDPEVTEKKVMNLLKLLNGKKDLINLTSLTKTRVLYSVVRNTPDDHPTKIIIKDYDGSGVSRDNAVFTIRKGVFHGS